MKSALLAAALMTTLLSASHVSAEPASPFVGLFAQDASLGNAFEIDESKIILETSTNPVVRAFAEEMIHDHTIAQAELDRLGRRAGVPTDIIPGKAQKTLVDDLGLMDSPKLDKVYLSDQSKAHARAVALISDYAINGEDPAFRAYARATLPMVLIHQRMLVEISGKKPHL
ncbi:DUF4142 domain-containing protein [Lichenihabitans psoromatis]|uniref:DUF4142 domain-containing protein n=1 Tax=Lichenihabitans psoromatis TaxID=2528642 RepID=UPI001035EB12|nr:DUF4142 domain-containing protein [Lichenihabitans psoromatis]